MRIIVVMFLGMALQAQPVVEAGAELFAGACGGCHGSNGEGGVGPGLADGRRVRRLSDTQLFEVIKKGAPGTSMPPSTLPDEKIRRIAGFLRGLSRPAIATAMKGDPSEGREVFFKKGGCASCHMIRGEGGFPGPDLSDVGATRTPRQLREAVLEPDARIPADFRAVTVVTGDGREIRGVAKSYTNYSIGILDATGELHLLETKGVKKITFSDRSMMPSDYARRLTARELENLLAFLSRQSVTGRASE